MPTLEASENTFMFAMAGGRFYSCLLAASKHILTLTQPPSVERPRARPCCSRDGVKIEVLDCYSTIY